MYDAVVGLSYKKLYMYIHTHVYIHVYIYIHVYNINTCTVCVRGCLYTVCICPQRDLGNGILYRHASFASVTYTHL